MTTSVGRLRTMDPGENAPTLSFLKVFKIKLNLARISFLFSLSSLESYDPTILTLINFGRDVTRTDSMEERNVCSTNFEKSCELVEVKTFIIFQNQCLKHNPCHLLP